jgi:hypothetical protein
MKGVLRDWPINETLRSGRIFLTVLSLEKIIS